jgi:hypothetical protein
VRRSASGLLYIHPPPRAQTVLFSVSTPLTTIHSLLFSFYTPNTPFHFFTLYTMARSMLALGLVALTTLSAAKPVAIARSNSGKRGVAFNEGAFTKLFGAGGDQFSWCYNWVSSAGNTASNLEYVPMLHAPTADFTGSWKADLAKAIEAGATHLLGFNEPDQCG